MPEFPHPDSPIAKYHDRRRAQGKYYLSPETLRLLNEWEIAHAPKRRRNPSSHISFPSVIREYLTRNREASGPELYRALREAGSPGGDSTVHTMRERGELSVEVRDGKRWYRLNNQETA